MHYETYWSIKLLPYANITDISTDITDISTNINTDVILVSLLNFTDIRYCRYQCISNVNGIMKKSLEQRLLTKDHIATHTPVCLNLPFILHCLSNQTV